MSNGVFVSKLGLCFLPFYPDLPGSGPVPFIPRSPHFPTLFTYAVLGSGWQECGLNLGPVWPVGVVAHLVWGAGGRALVIWGNAVRGYAGSLVSCKSETKQKSPSIILSTVSSVAIDPKDGMGSGRRVGEVGSSYGFWVKPKRSPRAPLSKIRT